MEAASLARQASEEPAAPDVPPMVSFMSNFRCRPTRAAGERQHRCSICPQTFARSEHLLRHERSHRGEKPFRCSICNTQFTRKDLIRRHMRRQHPGEADQQETLPSRRQGSTGTISYSSSCDPLLNWEPPTPNSAGMAIQSNGNGNGNGNGNSNGLRTEFVGTTADPFDFDALFWDMDYGDGTRNPHGTRAQPGAATSAGVELARPPFLLDVELNAAAAFPLPRLPEQVSANPRSASLGSFEISESKRAVIDAEMKTFQTHGGFEIPSCLQLERFITACFDSLFSLLPCIHLPTWRAEDAHPCLLLAMASLGAKYSKRHDMALALHRVARAATLNQEVTILEAEVDDQPLWLMQALFLVMCFGAWSGKLKMSQEALAMQSLLAERFRSGQVSKLGQDCEQSSLGWAEWVEMETLIRTRCTVYQYFSLITRAFNLAPPICNAEIDLPMPSSDAEWTAPTSKEWLACRAHSRKRPMFLATLDGLLGTSTEVEPFLSPFGAHIMLHALLLQLWFLRQDRWSPCSDSHLAHLCSALDKWEAMARLDPETSISPYGPQALLSYNSHLLLRLVRLYLRGDLGRVHTTFSSHSVERISRAMMTELKVGRFAPDTQAALLAAHSLRVPLKVGVALNSGCGSLQYQLFALDCGLYLSKWLHGLLATPEMSWSQQEKEVVALARSTIREADLPLEKAQKPLSSQIAHACSLILDGIDTWGISGIVLGALRKYADDLA
ncbi:hypothetical protein CDV36_015287 [Fusarium kuroshium]|uniref:C2H2-type domain-containing protein n=1 Tax=Fusarium kuroshium TaxID=2010991 RepID=A0A3M2RBD1_9HYPO|nr:hypothetical protein CDV36_015287 [Fusarium kuroshium]